MRATIFDCDGTLVDSQGLAAEALLGLTAEQGLTLSIDEVLARFRGVTLAECVSQLEAYLGHSLPQDFVQKLRTRTAEVFRARLRRVEGAFGLVRSISGPICVASSDPTEKIELSPSLTGLFPFFESRIFSSCEISSWKPDPALFLHAARTMGVEPEACVVVEGSLPGIRAGIAAGMHVFAYQPNGIDPKIPSNVIVVERLSELQPTLD